MMQKKLMQLGGSRYLLPAIETAHKLGVHEIMKALKFTGEMEDCL